MFRNSFIFLVIIFSFMHGQLKDKYEYKSSALNHIKKEQISTENVQIDNEKNSNEVKGQVSYDISGSINDVNINSRNSRSLSESFEWQVFPPYKWYFYSNNWLNDISKSSSTAYSGDYSSRFCSKEAIFDPFGVQTQDQYMISPKLNVGEGETFSFWHDQSDWSGEKFMVGISTTDQSLESFTYGPEFTRENGSAGVWVQHVEDLSDYEGQEIYVSIRYTSFWKHYLYIDHVEGPSIVLEPEPDAYLSADTLSFPSTYIQSSSSLDLIIGNGGEGDLIGTLTSNNSHFEIGNFNGTVPSGEEEIITITYTPSEAHNNSNGSFDYDQGYLTFTNSETGDSDQIYVKGSGSDDIIFESFENEFPPSGWTIFSNNSNNSVTQSDSRAHSGIYAAKFNSYWTAESGDYTQYIITPQVYIPPSGATFSMFYITNWTFWSGLSPESFMVGVSTNGPDTNNFIWFDEFVVTEGEWNEHIEELSMFAGQNVHVAIKYTSVYLQNLHIDDIQISPGGNVTLPLISGYSEEVDFGEVIFGESSNISFDFHNIGVSDLHITNVHFNPSDAFSVGSETIFPHTTAPSDSNGFYIVFEPTSNENNIYFTEMTIESNMLADIQVSLTGIGRSSDMQVYNRIVLIEDFTAAEWCPYCPIGSFAVRDLIDDNPDEIISIQWQVQNSYFDENDCIKAGDSTCTSVRGNLYDIAFIPSEIFNGTDIVVGADVEWDNYGRYDSVFQNLRGMKSDYNISISGSKNGSTVSYSVNVLNEYPFTNNDCDLHIFIVEDSISTSWAYQGIGDSIDFANNVVRVWKTDPMFEQEGVLDYTYNSTFDFHDKPWDTNQIKIIAIIQDKFTKEIYQASQINTNTFEFLNVSNPGSLSGNQIPISFALHQNYPNPFNPLTSIQYDLPNISMVNISVYDMMGRKVKTLVNGIQNSGFKTIQWNAKNEMNSPVSAGLYFYTIQTDGFKETKRMILLK